MGVMNEDRLTLYDGLIKTHITNTTVAKETGKGLSTNDYTTTEKNKLAGIADGANKTVVDSALNTSSTNPVQNKIIAGEINTLKKSVSDGKTLVATAITDKGVNTAADATFAVMANNISQIETGGGELHGATISVTTTESTLIGKTIKLSLNSTTVDTKTFDNNGACSFTDIQEAGTYSLYSTDGTDSATITVDITAENVVNKTVISCEFYLTPDGEIVTPVDDVAILLKCAEIKDKSYTTMDELLADEQAMGDITMSENAMKYLARSTGFADAVCANETFMTLLGQSAYVDATVLNSDLWFNKCLESQYFDKVFKDVRTIHAGAYETITMSFTNRTITTNSDGNVIFPIPNGTYTFTGSVSGQSFTRTVTKDTTDVYVCPENCAYWYGNMFGATFSKYADSGVGFLDLTVNTNNLYAEENGSYVNGYMVSIVKRLNLNGMKKLKAICTYTCNGAQSHANIILRDICYPDNSPKYEKNIRYSTNGTINDVQELDISDIASYEYGYVSVATYNRNFGELAKFWIYAIWLE